MLLHQSTHVYQQRSYFPTATAFATRMHNRSLHTNKSEVCRSVGADLPETCPQKARALCHGSAPKLPVQMTRLGDGLRNIPGIISWILFLLSRGARCIVLETFPNVGKTTPVGFEPTRGDPIGLAGRRLNRSAKVSCRERYRARPQRFTLIGRPAALQWNRVEAKDCSLWITNGTLTRGKSEALKILPVSPAAPDLCSSDISLWCRSVSF